VNRNDRLARTPQNRLVGRRIHHRPGRPVDRVAGPAPSVRVIDSLPEIERLEPVWRMLTRTEAAPFQTFGWNLSWYRHFPHRYDEPLVFLFERGGHPLAILPAYRRGGEIRLAGDRHGDFQDLVARCERAAERAVDELLRWRRREAPACRLVFEKVSTEGFLHAAALRDRAEHDGMLAFARTYAPCPCAPLEGGLEPYLASLPRKKRQDFRRALRRFDREFGGGRIEIDYAGFEDLERIIRVILEGS